MGEGKDDAGGIVGEDSKDDDDTEDDSGGIGGKARGDNMGDDVDVDSDDPSREGEGNPSEDGVGVGCATGGAVGSIGWKGLQVES